MPAVAPPRPLKAGRRASGAAIAAWAVSALVISATLSSCSSSSASSAGASSYRVLRVGTFHGVVGQYRTIQAAVDAAKPGDWILVAPGDYHEADDLSAPVSSAAYNEGDFGAVRITTSDVHLRGMDRNTVIVDGTDAGAPTPCTASAKFQQFGPTGPGDHPWGRNGIVVWKADDVSIENLTACNFLGGVGDSGNGIWWNGGDGSGRIGLQRYHGDYLTATSTFYDGPASAAQYGIFASNAHGPGVWVDIYASNFADSGMYVGGCRQVCDMTIEHAWMQYSALGYSGTNSGGRIVIEYSRFDHNKDGLDTNTQIGADPPAPQNGACPGASRSTITGTHSCWVFVHNVVMDNNDADVPASGSASYGPTGTGMTVSGGRNDTVMDNTFVGNGAWGILFVPYPDSDQPVLGQTCSGTGGVELSGFGCVYDPEGDALVRNTFDHNGYFGNPSKADFGQIVVVKGQARNCFVDNRAPNGSAPPGLEQTQPTCGPLMPAADTGGGLLTQVLCDTGFSSCPPGAHYPPATKVVMEPLPALPTMPNPCAGVPGDPWCPDGRPL